MDGEDPANDFKIIVATESLNNRSHRLISFEPPLLVETEKVLQITYSNTASRAVKIADLHGVRTCEQGKDSTPI